MSVHTMVSKALRAAVAILPLLVVPPAPSTAQGTLDWIEFTRGVSIALDGADNVYTVDFESAPGAEMILTKRTPNGQLLWQASYDQLDSTRWERASWVATDSLGNAIVCGTSMSGFSNPVEAASIVMKFDANGGVEWRQVYESNFEGSYAKKCLVDAGDNVYVLGTGHGPAGYVTKVKKFAPDGTALWSYYDADGIGLPVNFKLTPDGFLAITGRSVFGSVNGYAKINLQGQKVWSRPGVFSLTVGDAAGDLLGNTYLVHAEYVTNPRTAVKKIDPAGALIWERFYALGGARVEVGNDNLAVVGGFPNFNSAGAAFIKIDESGELLWSNLDADGPLMLLLHSHMLLDGSNNVYLAASNLFSMAVCKVGYDGTSGWTATVSGSNTSAIAIGSGDSSVFVVGGATARLRNGPPVGTAPDAPSALTSGLLTSTSVELRWTDNASDETGFTLERCPGTLAFCQANPAQFAVRATLGANATAHTDPGLVGGTPYSWRVQAFNAAGRSPYSNTLSVTTPTPPPTPPAAPSALTSSLLTPTSVGLRWTDNASDETGFTLERCPGTLAFCQSNPAQFTVRATLGVNLTAHTDSGLVGGTPYSWRVQAFNAAGRSPYSNTFSVTTPTTTPPRPATPTNLKAALKGLGIRARVGLTWTDKATDETAYTVERCAGSTCTSFAAIAALPRNSRTYTDSGVTPGVTYRYRVMATGPGGNSAYSNIAQVKTR